MITRRRLVLAIGAGVLAAPFAAIAQQQQRIYRIGMVTSNDRLTSAHLTEAFTQGLRELGYIEGKNILIDRRFSEGNLDHLPALAANLVQQKVEVIFAPDGESARAAKQATGTIPIVFASVSDPIGSGFIASLARPGGNITGISNFAQELSAKRLELLKEAFPKIKRAAVFVSSEPIAAVQFAEVQRAAKALGMEVLAVKVQLRYDIEQGFAQLRTWHAELRKWRADSMYFLETTNNYYNRKLLAEFVAKMRLPAIFGSKDYAEAGGLMSYGVSYESNYRRAATYIDKILKGAKPSDIPVEQPTKFELVINRKTAKALRLTIPQQFRLRADKVIE